VSARPTEITRGREHCARLRRSEGSWTVLKTPSVKEIWNFARLFGGAKLLLLIRDGRDVEESWRNAFPESSIDQVATGGFREVAPQGEWFRPIERWRSWSAERQQEFIAIAGPELRGFWLETSAS
jgi:hypothetical protein